MRTQNNSSRLVSPEALSGRDRDFVTQNMKQAVTPKENWKMNVTGIYGSRKFASPYAYGKLTPHKKPVQSSMIKSLAAASLPRPNLKTNPSMYKTQDKKIG